MRKLLYALAASALLFTSWAQAQPELRSDHPERYTVVKGGDTLWDISARFLNNPWYWPEIWHVNPQVANPPHLIYPGDRLALVYIDGKPPRITKVATSDVVKLSPPQVRSEAIDTPIPAIPPLDAIASFLTETRIVSPEEINGAPYVLEGEDGRIITGAVTVFTLAARSRPIAWVFSVAVRNLWIRTPASSLAWKPEHCPRQR